ncbi:MULTISPECIES: Na+/H+ antiporter subunit G [Pseudomonas]|uniref:Monovalent cation/proton antiporter subunit MnhG/PhaG n=2 Tax=Pseudomonas TaxID=286 RepID=A0A2X2FC56_PSELU|nr:MULTISPECIES: Na+/H+ antiporter subunit G [Pseudomonas]AYN96078.1 Na+/H+ antiporter subunit G [Pseudomonas sp. LTJR-52]ENA28324.1 monovalent cation/proton antiporter, MnhG/PhaG subunit [Pseudomonas sp. HPB0071]MBA1246380.1 Na+/H+ antiporter subunit G [Pseudomonas zeshuii]MBF8641291.1 Na+/H+ antiporter subunit G [Pseudomonas zeshuii]MBW5413469.1 Na+/H+ antiporter subunit G [Pseudomonas sp. MAG002Y]
MNPWLEGIVCVLLLVGSVFTLIGSIGLLRLPDFFTRLHGPTKATTLGVGSTVIASMLYFTTQHDGLSLHELLIPLFLFITAPVSAQILCKSAMQQRLKRTEKTKGEPWQP